MSIVGMAQAQPRAHVTAIESFYKGPMARLTASSDTDQLGSSAYARAYVGIHSEARVAFERRDLSPPSTAGGALVAKFKSGRWSCVRDETRKLQRR